jgi:lysozyme
MQAADLMQAMAIVQQHVTVMLNGDQLGALTSFVDNEGPGEAGVKDGFVVLKSGQPSTMLLMINAGNPAWVNQLDLWVYGDGEKLLGLVRRRFAEKMVALSRLDMTLPAATISGDV